VAERFRLIHFKSARTEDASSDGFPSSRRLGGVSENASFETFSSRAILLQAKADLKHPDPKIRTLAIQHLEKCGPTVAMPLIQEIVSDPDPDVRARALRSLSRFRNPTVIPLLKKCLKDADSWVRIIALGGLFQYREKIDLNILLQFLSDDSPWVRRKVATLLGWTQLEGAFPILVQLSKDQDSKVRKAALVSLIALYPEESGSSMMRAMTDSDPDLRD
jgi:HEAT repeat protein